MEIELKLSNTNYEIHLILEIKNRFFISVKLK